MFVFDGICPGQETNCIRFTQKKRFYLFQKVAGTMGLEEFSRLKKCFKNVIVSVSGNSCSKKRCIFLFEKGLMFRKRIVSV